MLGCSLKPGVSQYQVFEYSEMHKCTYLEPLESLECLMDFPQDGSGSLPAILVGFVNFCYLAGMYTTHQNQQTASQFGRPGAIE